MNLFIATRVEAIDLGSEVGCVVYIIKANTVIDCKDGEACHMYTKGPSTKEVRQMGRGGGFEISDIPGRGEGVVCESSDVRKFLKKIEIPKFLRAL